LDRAARFFGPHGMAERVWMRVGGEGLEMILETAVLNVRAGQEADFEASMQKAHPLIALTPGFIGMKLHRCIESPNRYLLLVSWRTIEDHTVGFRKSDRYEQWRDLLHHFYDPFPTVDRYEEALALVDVDSAGS